MDGEDCERESGAIPNVWLCKKSEGWATFLDNERRCFYRQGLKNASVIYAVKSDRHLTCVSRIGHTSKVQKVQDSISIL